MKLKMTFIFTVGGLSGIIGFVKIGIVYRAANTNGRKTLFSLQPFLLALTDNRGERHECFLGPPTNGNEYLLRLCSDVQSFGSSSRSNGQCMDPCQICRLNDSHWTQQEPLQHQPLQQLPLLIG